MMIDYLLNYLKRLIGPHNFGMLYFLTTYILTDVDAIPETFRNKKIDYISFVEN